MQRLENKVALITGGSKGIGFGIAAALMAEGMNVAITSRSLESAQEAAAELNKSGKGKALAIEADVRDYTSQENAIKQVMEKWGRLDLLVANAGIGHFAPVEELSLAQWHETIDTNLTGVFYSVKAGFEALKESKGYFISISSLAGTNFFANGSAYNASKFGVTGFTQAAMLDLRKYGIRCTTIMPGSVSTYFNNHVPNDKDGWKIQIEDLGQMVVDLMQMHPRTLPSKIEVRPTMPA
ncbi:SDR family oxidoreductase [Fontibacter flavus]|uniref:SDR family oxidoreductase n=1 Tax=Fontibacter flavus TaxID=654838 RepID=A0ABV6FTK6_9BACT